MLLDSQEATAKTGHAVAHVDSQLKLSLMYGPRPSRKLAGFGPISIRP